MISAVRAWTGVLQLTSLPGNKEDKSEGKERREVPSCSFLISYALRLVSVLVHKGSAREGHCLYPLRFIPLPCVRPCQGQGREECFEGLRRDMGSWRVLDIAILMHDKVQDERQRARRVIRALSRSIYLSKGDIPDSKNPSGVTEVSEGGMRASVMADPRFEALVEPCPCFRRLSKAVWI
jgi:hypothetical protein